MQALNVSQNALYKKRDSETTNQIFSKFNTNTGTTTKCSPFIRAFASTEVVGTLLFMELSCQSWECKSCGPKLRWKWYKKQLEQYLDTPHLEYTVIQANQWDKVRKQIQRADGKYMKYVQKDNMLLIVSDIHISVYSSMPHINSIPLENRKEFLIQAIVNTPLIRQPISQSRNWNTKIEDEGKKKKVTSKWEAIDICKDKTLVEVTRILKSEGYIPSMYQAENSLFSGIKGLVVTLKVEDYFRILWKIGILRNAA